MASSLLTASLAGIIIPPGRKYLADAATVWLRNLALCHDGQYRHQTNMQKILNYHQAGGDHAVVAAISKSQAEKNLQAAAYSLPSVRSSGAAPHVPAQGAEPIAAAGPAPSSGTMSDDSLLARFKNNPTDTRAVDGLIQRHWKPLFAQCRMLTSNADEALVLAQTAWKRALQVLPTVSTPDNLRSFLVQIATKLWRSQLQLRQSEDTEATAQGSVTHPETVDGIITISFSAAATDGLKTSAATEQLRLKQELDLALNGLAPRERDVILAHYLNGECQADIGRRYNQSEEVVSGWLTAALERIKTHFEPRRASSRLGKDPN